MPILWGSSMSNFLIFTLVSLVRVGAARLLPLMAPSPPPPTVVMRETAPHLRVLSVSAVGATYPPPRLSGVTSPPLRRSGATPFRCKPAPEEPFFFANHNAVLPFFSQDFF